jgi:hypothetical protein
VEERNKKKKPTKGRFPIETSKNPAQKVHFYFIMPESPDKIDSYNPGLSPVVAGDRSSHKNI